MKKELTIEHLAAYLPHKVRAKALDPKRRYPYKRNDVFGFGVLCGLTDNPCMIDVKLDGSYASDEVATDECKLLLRPLSQLTETIEHNGERFVPMEVLNRDFPQECKHYGNATDANSLPYCIMKRLLSWHFDIFQLGDSGLAEPIPSIEQP